MKRILIVLSILVLFSVQDTWALSNFKTNEVEEGKVAVSLQTTNTGYVSSLMIQLKVEGNVTPLSFHWSDAMKSSYTRKIIFNDVENTLLLVIATGNSENLMNEEGVISLGTLEILGNTTKSERYYKVVVDQAVPIELVTNDYQKLVLNDLEVQEDITYVLQAKKEEASKSEGEQNSNSNEEATLPPEDHTVKADDENGDNVEILTPSNKEEEKPVVKAPNSYLIPVGITLGAFIVGGGIYIWYRKHRKISF